MILSDTEVFLIFLLEVSILFLFFYRGKIITKNKLDDLEAIEKEKLKEQLIIHLNKFKESELDKLNDFISQERSKKEKEINESAKNILKRKDEEIKVELDQLNAKLLKQKKVLENEYVKYDNKINDIKQKFVDMEDRYNERKMRLKNGYKKLKKKLENDIKNTKSIYEKYEHKLDNIEKNAEESIKPFQHKLFKFINMSRHFLNKIETDFGNEIIDKEFLRIGFDIYYAITKKNIDSFNKLQKWAETINPSVELLSNLIDKSLSKINSLNLIQQEKRKDLDFDESFILVFQISGRLDQLIEMISFFKLVEELFIKYLDELKNRDNQKRNKDDDDSILKEFYEILEITPGDKIDIEHIKKLYKEKLHIYHPDKNSNKTAYEIKLYTQVCRHLNKGWKIFNTRRS